MCNSNNDVERKKEFDQFLAFDMWAEEIYGKAESEFLSVALLSVLNTARAIKQANFQLARTSIYDLVDKFNKSEIDFKSLTIINKDISERLQLLIECAYTKQTDIKFMARLCNECLSIKVGDRNKKAHANLVEISSSNATLIGQKKFRITTYKCKKCGTTWQHEDDKNDSFAGWTVVEA